MNERIKAIVSGKVQGVYYRNFIIERALELGLVGKAENLQDGTVLVIAEGPRDALETLIEHLHEGPVHARVATVLVERPPATGEHDAFTKH